MRNNTAYTYDDIQLIPQYSTIESRSTVSLKTRLSKNYNIMVPFIASPMDTVCELDMAIKMVKLGGVGCLHRFMGIEEQSRQVKELQTFLYNNKEELYGVWGDERKPIMAAIGATGDSLERAQELVKAGTNVLLIDVAHGHHENVRKTLHSLQNLFGDTVDVIAGNVATHYAAYDLCEWGADGIRVGIGGGSLCTTRIETGHGIPNVTSIKECVRATDKWNVPVMADGGIRSAGDIAKAIAVGADSVMLGSLLAATQEAPGLIIEQSNQLYKRYRGSASLETKSAHGQATRNIEGASTIIPYKGGVKYVIYRLSDGLRSALSYTGADSIEKFQSTAEYVIVTTAGINEAKPHLLF